MAQKIHYRDDLFFLSTLEKAIEAGLAVDTDPEFFRERLSGDIFFLDGSLRAFAELLVQNSHLIERIEYLKLLERVCGDFARCLGALVAGELPQAEAYRAYAAQFQAMATGQRGLAAQLASLVSEATESGRDADLVSEDELSELLRG